MDTDAAAATAAEQQPPLASLLTVNHQDWLRQGGADPSAPSLGVKSDVKIIDYAQPSREQLRREIADALQEDGFFVLVNHTVPVPQVLSMLDVARQFFARVAYGEEGRRTRVKDKIAMNTMLRPLTKAARGFADYEEETLNLFMGPDQKFTFDYALQNDAAFIGRREAFRKEEAALYAATTPTPTPTTTQEDVAALRAKYHRQRTCEEHLGKNLWPDECTEAEEAAAARESGGGKPAAHQRRAPGLLSSPMPGMPFAASAPEATEKQMKSEMLQLRAELLAEKGSGPGASAKAPHGFRAACESYLAGLFPLSMDLLSLILEGAGGLSGEEVARDVAPLFADPLVIQRLISYPPQRTREQLRREGVPAARARAAIDRRVAARVAERAAAGVAPCTTKSNYKGLPMAEYQALVDEAMNSLVDERISMSCGAHVDYGALTLIAEDRGEALEMWRKKAPKGEGGGYEYLPALPPGALVVSTGFMLEKITNGRIAATRHRVQNVRRTTPGGGPDGDSAQPPPPTSRDDDDVDVRRTALAFFLDPHPEAYIAPLPQCVKAAEGGRPLYEGCVAGAKGVRFGDPRYLGHIAQSLGLLGDGGEKVATGTPARQQAVS